ncbi:5-nitroimidazole antibiotic resistance protein, putative [Trichomonas vaginalis G3]|uniref:5-nitroimidazole antibiotic resistance protein, putative n=1 Tax=Trichomonas vaginalis (strain ATCC PRA-98 / G3) TaxID=412133 RepID=A2E6Z6_TRIV3|nr:5-nitroimidazole antibiotic resistance protein [Trichomonas vaginalis G3]EAY11514.1 5-nitroimidazole antibiotic resistance protein, putative [Trichomonas vaginalis G3]KAI5489399.1 5-nitroimidazole antibiotic resistance protein [Trichomonas vaginalis G3]|eukprot:XP_001323737.1 5-nitroimidazole antibiotic resistance protein [Trichomonas vaginalis G3]
MLSSISRLGHVMRRGDREIKDLIQIKKFLKEQPYGVLCLNDHDKPYGIPLCYGFTWDKDEKFPTFYFHGAQSGRKIGAIKNNSDACLTISKPLKLVYFPGRPPCTATMNYESVIAEGKVELLTHKDEIKTALDSIITQFDIPLGKYKEASLKRTAVIKFITNSLSMKRNTALE